MKRVALSLFGIALMVCSTGCCLLGGSSCGSPCGPCGGGGTSYYGGGGGGGCSSGQCGAGAAYPQGAFYNGNGAPATAYAPTVTQTAMVPVQALPTF